MDIFKEVVFVFPLPPYPPSNITATLYLDLHLDLHLDQDQDQEQNQDQDEDQDQVDFDPCPICHPFARKRNRHRGPHIFRASDEGRYKCNYCLLTNFSKYALFLFLYWIV